MKGTVYSDWKNLPNHSRYRFYSNGDVIEIHGNMVSTVKKHFTSGTLWVTLTDDTGTSAEYQLARIIIELFRGIKPTSGYEVSYLDKDPKNVNYANLVLKELDNYKETKTFNTINASTAYKNIDLVINVITDICLGVDPLQTANHYGVNYKYVKLLRYGNIFRKQWKIEFDIENISKVKIRKNSIRDYNLKEQIMLIMELGLNGDIYEISRKHKMTITLLNNIKSGNKCKLAYRTLMNCMSLYRQLTSED